MLLNQDTDLSYLTASAPPIELAVDSYPSMFPDVPVHAPFPAVPTSSVVAGRVAEEEKENKSLVSTSEVTYV